MQIPLEPSQGTRGRSPDRASRMEPSGTWKSKEIQAPTEAQCQAREKSKEVSRKECRIGDGAAMGRTA